MDDNKIPLNTDWEGPNCAIRIGDETFYIDDLDVQCDRDAFQWAIFNAQLVFGAYKVMALKHNLIIKDDEYGESYFMTDNDSYRNTAGYFGYEEINKLLNMANTRKDINDATEDFLKNLERFARMRIPKKNIELITLVILKSEKPLAMHECFRPIPQRLL